MRTVACRPMFCRRVKVHPKAWHIWSLNLVCKATNRHMRLQGLPPICGKASWKCITPAIWGLALGEAHRHRTSKFVERITSKLSSSTLNNQRFIVCSQESTGHPYCERSNANKQNVRVICNSERLTNRKVFIFSLLTKSGAPDEAAQSSVHCLDVAAQSSVR